MSGISCQIFQLNITNTKCARARVCTFLIIFSHEEYLILGILGCYMIVRIVVALILKMTDVTFRQHDRNSPQAGDRVVCVWQCRRCLADFFAMSESRPMLPSSCVFLRGPCFKAHKKKLEVSKRVTVTQTGVQ